MDISFLYILISTLYAAMYAGIKYYCAHLEGEAFDMNKMVPFIILAMAVGVANSVIMGTPTSIEQITEGIAANLGFLAVIQAGLNAIYKKWSQWKPVVASGV